MKKTKTQLQLHIQKKPIPNDTWGASLSDKCNDSTRIFFQNINGLKDSKKKCCWEQHMIFMKEIGCEISGLAKTNTNWNFGNKKQALTQISNMAFPNSRINFSTNNFNTTSNYSFLPGGAIQLCCNHWTGRIMRSINDPRKMGRWTGHQYRLKENKSLTVITA